MATKKILVIDDDETIQDLLKSALEAYGYQVDIAPNGQFGFGKAVTDVYDLITMDIKMPQWNGLEAIGSLEIVKPELKIIVISSFLNDAENSEASKSSNVVKLLNKPFQIEELITTVKKYI